MRYTNSLELHFALGELYETRRDFQAQMLSRSETHSAVQLAKRVGLLSQQQLLFGGCDHARNDALLTAYRELRHVLSMLIRNVPVTSTARLVAGATPFLLELTIGEHLAPLLRLASASTLDDSRYSLDWQTALHLAYEHLLELTRQLAVHSTEPPAKGMASGYFIRRYPQTQEDQVHRLSGLRDYQLLPDGPFTKIRFFLAPLLLVGVWQDGTRKNFELAPVVRKEADLPDLAHSPIELTAGATPELGFVDRAGTHRKMIYNVQTLQYDLQ